MKKLIFTLLMFIGIALLSTPTQSDAAYKPKWDLTLKVNVLEDMIKPSGKLGEVSFNLQEGVHNTLTDTTGVEVDHSYIWIELNGVKVLAVDPPKPVFN